MTPSRIEIQIGTGKSALLLMNSHIKKLSPPSTIVGTSVESEICRWRVWKQWVLWKKSFAKPSIIALIFSVTCPRIMTRKRYKSSPNDSKFRWSRMFEASYPISIFSFLHQFKAECVSNDIKGGEAMWFVPNFMKKLASQALKTRLRTPKKIETKRPGRNFRVMFCCG